MAQPATIEVPLHLVHQPSKSPPRPLTSESGGGLAGGCGGGGAMAAAGGELEDGEMAPDGKYVVTKGSYIKHLMFLTRRYL